MKDDDRGLITAGYWTAVLFPIVGFIIGIILLTRNRVRQGVTAMIVAVLVAIAASAVFAAVQVSDEERAQQQFENFGEELQKSLEAVPTVDSDGDGEPDETDSRPNDELAQ